jgi:hypothetical protein
VQTCADCVPLFGRDRATEPQFGSVPEHSLVELQGVVQYLLPPRVAQIPLAQSADVTQAAPRAAPAAGGPQTKSMRLNDSFWTPWHTCPPVQSTSCAQLFAQRPRSMAVPPLPNFSSTHTEPAPNAVVQSVSPVVPLQHGTVHWERRGSQRPLAHLVESAAHDVYAPPVPVATAPHLKQGNPAQLVGPSHLSELSEPTQSAWFWQLNL